MRSFGIVQLNARTPTLPTGARFFFQDIPGSTGRSTSIPWSTSMVMQCFGAISPAAGRTGFWKFPYGCFTGQHVLPAAVLVLRM